MVLGQRLELSDSGSSK